MDTIDEAAQGFYRHHGFDGIEDSNRLVIKFANAAAILG